jgi:hypothetical protein
MPSATRRAHCWGTQVRRRVLVRLPQHDEEESDEQHSEAREAPMQRQPERALLHASVTLHVLCGRHDVSRCRAAGPVPACGEHRRVPAESADGGGRGPCVYAAVLRGVRCVLHRCHRHCCMVKCGMQYVLRRTLHAAALRPLHVASACTEGSLPTIVTIANSSNFCTESDLIRSYSILSDLIRSDPILSDLIRSYPIRSYPILSDQRRASTRQPRTSRTSPSAAEASEGDCARSRVCAGRR